MNDSAPTTVESHCPARGSRPWAGRWLAPLAPVRGPLCLVLLVAANLAVAYAIAIVAARTTAAASLPPWTARALLFTLGVALAQGYLLVLWLGLAGPSALVRYPLAGIVLLVATSILSAGLGSRQGGDGALLAAFAAVPILASHLPLLSLRWLLGWRLAFDARNYPIERAGPTQFYLAHCLWLMALWPFPWRFIDHSTACFGTERKCPPGCWRQSDCS